MTPTSWLDHLAGLATRREFLRRSTGLGAIWLGLDLPGPPRPVRFSSYPFMLGVASGDPSPDGVVLWTRLAPDPLSPGGGMPGATTRVRWEIAHDDRFSRLAASGVATARPEWAHSVHVEVEGLDPDRVYWYRFVAGGEASPVGRTRTAPLGTATPAEVRFAFASCQHYEQGLFTALRHLSDEDLRFVVHLGDYIYESGGAPSRVRSHAGSEPDTLEAYRRRYAQYKLDADLQAAHAAAPWIVTWDDHEVDNNYAGAAASDHSPRDLFLLRRAAAYQACWEHMPLRSSAVPSGPDARVYRYLACGSLIGMSVLDGRQYRSDQPCDDGVRTPCPGMYDESATMLGAAQERWLMDGLAASRTRWNVLANQVPLSRLDNEPGDAERYSMDRWDGYVAARRRLTSFLHERGPENPIVLTGDIHSNWVGELRADFETAGSPVVGVEFIGTSLSSGGDGSDTSAFGQRMLAANPDLRFFNNQRGYVRCSVTPALWRSDYRVVDYVSRPGSPVTTRASFVVQSGQPRVDRA